jgi:hypothetical protein
MGVSTSEARSNLDYELDSTQCGGSLEKTKAALRNVAKMRTYQI